MADTYEVWKTTELSQNFLEGVRGAIPLAAEQLAMMMRVIRTAQPQAKNFLDLGCGDGVLGRTILGEYPQATGVFLDFSETMMQAAQNKLAEHSGNLVFLMQDFGSTSWINSVQVYAPFDVIVSGFSIHHQPDFRKQEIYREIFNLLTPGGIFLNLEHVASSTPWVENLFDELFIDSLYAYHQGLGSEKTRTEIDQQYYNRPDKTANLLTSVELQCHWLRELGFIHVDCFMKLFEIALFGGIKPNVFD